MGDYSDSIKYSNYFLDKNQSTDIFMVRAQIFEKINQPQIAFENYLKALELE